MTESNVPPWLAPVPGAFGPGGQLYRDTRFAAPDGGVEEDPQLATEDDLRNSVRFYRDEAERFRRTAEAQHAALERANGRLGEAADEIQALRDRLEAETTMKNSFITGHEEALVRVKDMLDRAQSAEKECTRLRNSSDYWQQEAGRYAQNVDFHAARADRAEQQNEHARDLVHAMETRPFIDGESSPHEAARRFLTDCGLEANPDAIAQLSEVFLECLRIMCERGYDPNGLTWQAAGWRGQLFEMRKKLERAWWRSWKNGIFDPDSVWDLINYAGFYLRADAWREGGDGWGRWGEGDGTPPAPIAVLSFPDDPPTWHSERDGNVSRPVMDFPIPPVRDIEAAKKILKGYESRQWKGPFDYSTVPDPYGKPYEFADDPENTRPPELLIEAYRRKVREGEIQNDRNGPGRDEPEFGYKEYDAKNPGEWFTRHNHGPGVLCTAPCRSADVPRRAPRRGPGNVAGSGWS